MSEFINRLHKVLAFGMLGISPELGLENTNIAGYDELHHFTDFNRLRAELTLEHEEYSDIVGRVIVDNKTRYTATPDSLGNKTSVYRAYLQYKGLKHFWSAGKQRIPLGVGRIWNPVDVFNPVDPEAVEPDERIGTESLRYEYAFTELSNLDVTLARDKAAMRIKGYLEYVDAALIGLVDEDNDQDIVGWELAGRLPETGIELRSEGGSFHDRSSGERHTEFIVGAEYGFANSLTLLGEYKFSDEDEGDYLGGMLSYQPAMLWACGLLGVTSLEDSSGFVAPSLEYSLSDEMTLGLGAFLYYGDEEDTFGTAADHYYLRWFVYF
ncbi:hypothetical protein VU10_03470 [Desulfobulbus sp. US1]|nr:hypothetical protein [Desulfobulbus sp. US4]MCW5209250.1 hypothetical protein [Desulfobulbus sp. US1]